MPTLVTELEDALVDGPDRILVIAGAGVACASDPGNPHASWIGLLRDGVERCRQRCPSLKPGWEATTTGLIEEGGASSLVMAASRIKEELVRVHEGQYARWLADTVGHLHARDHQVVRGLLDWGATIATLNYDGLVEQVSGLPAVTWSQPGLAVRVLRGDEPGVLHLHGHFATPQSVVFDSRSYEEICRDPTAQSMLRACFTLWTIVFVGCGGTVDDPNFSVLWAFCRDALSQSPYSHFHLVRNRDLEDFGRMYTGLPVRPIGYGAEHTDLGPFLAQLSGRVQARRTPPTAADALRRSQADYVSVIEDLRSRRAGVPVEDFVRQTAIACRALRAAGGRRVAALELGRALRSAVGLPPGLVVTYGLEAAEWLLDDNLDVFAVRLLEGLGQHLSHWPAAAADQAQFRELLARALSARAEIDRALQTIDEALSQVPQDARGRLEAERAELRLLTGDLNEAERAGDN